MKLHSFNELNVKGRGREDVGRCEEEGGGGGRFEVEKVLGGEGGGEGLSC